MIAAAYFLIGLAFGLGVGMVMYVGSGREGLERRVSANLRRFLEACGGSVQTADGRNLAEDEILEALFEET